MLCPPSQLNKLSVAEYQLECQFDVTPDDPCFNGHFEQLPVLAAVVQIGWALQLAEQHFGHRLHFKALRSNKFQQLVRPPVSLHLTLEYKREKGLLKYCFSNRLGPCSRGGILVEEFADE